MAMFHVKKGEEVVVIAGSELGRRGKILSINAKKQRALVEGLKMIKRHTKRTQQNQQGSIVEREGSIHISNLVSASKYDERHGGAPAATETEQVQS